MRNKVLGLKIVEINPFFEIFNNSVILNYFYSQDIYDIDSSSNVYAMDQQCGVDNVVFDNFVKWFCQMVVILNMFIVKSIELVEVVGIFVWNSKKNACHSKIKSEYEKFFRRWEEEHGNCIATPSFTCLCQQKLIPGGQFGALFILLAEAQIMYVQCLLVIFR